MEKVYKFLLGMLESKVEELVGERAFKEVYKIREDAELKKILYNKSIAAEKRWILEYPNRDICIAIGELKIADLPSIQQSIFSWVNSPNSKTLLKEIEKQLQIVLPERFLPELEDAASAYLMYIVDELLFIDSLHNNLSLLSIKETEKNTAETNIILKDISSKINNSPNFLIRQLSSYILIVYAKGDEGIASLLAKPIFEAGYNPSLALLSEAVIQAARPVMELGGLVILCATQRAMGNRWTRQLLDAKRVSASARILGIQLEEDVEVDGAEYVVTDCCNDVSLGIKKVIEFTTHHYPFIPEAAEIQRGDDAEAHYRKAVLDDCDILKINNLPQPDKDVATRELKLRRLYVPLRAWVDIPLENTVNDNNLQIIENQRLLSKQLFENDEQVLLNSLRHRVSIGERLINSQRLVILGDPGSGKTTLTRWLTTAFLLRGDRKWNELPDVKTLPDIDLLPVIIRLREFDGDLPDTLDELLRHALRKTQLPESEVTHLHPVVLARIKRGEVLLMFDGLDEINDIKIRARFCSQLETIHTTYPNAMIIATSRIVGYNEMGYRLSNSFEHLTLADLEKSEKDDFARNWCELTEIPSQRVDASIKLINDIHSSDRIERLTGNPMLLTTMALVKRKVGKLPSRRAELYYEAVQVLLNWRSDVDTPLDWRETVPQLEYVAYAMCDKGIQRITKSDILSLLISMREAYPNLRLVQERRPEDFLKIVESRTGLLIEAGFEKRLGLLEQVYEFRHLTFQEYLAARAIVDGVFPGRDSKCSLASNIAPLAGRTPEFDKQGVDLRELVGEISWIEPLRLCVSICSNDDINPTLLAIITPLNGEVGETKRSRAFLAVLCIADEPENVSETIVQQIFQVFVKQISAKDGSGRRQTSADIAVNEMKGTRWANKLTDELIQNFIKSPLSTRGNLGFLCGLLNETNLPTEEKLQLTAFLPIIKQLQSGITEQIIESALLIVVHAYHRKINKKVSEILVQELFPHLQKPDPLAHAIAWALFWLNDKRISADLIWTPNMSQYNDLLVFLKKPDNDLEAIRYVIGIISKNSKLDALEPLEKLWLNSPDTKIRKAVINALGYIQEDRVIDILISNLYDPDLVIKKEVITSLGNTANKRVLDVLISNVENPNYQIRNAALVAIGKINDQRAFDFLSQMLKISSKKERQISFGVLITDDVERKLISRDLDGIEPFLDPKVGISRAFAIRASRELNIPLPEVILKYEAIAKRLQIKVKWKVEL